MAASTFHVVNVCKSSRLVLRCCRQGHVLAPLAQGQRRSFLCIPHRQMRQAAASVQRSIPNTRVTCTTEESSTATEQVGPRDDDILPDSLTDALLHASQATCLAMERSTDRCLVDILLPELWDPQSGAVFSEEGDQQRFWKLTRRFIETLSVEAGGKRIRAIYPDMGVAAMLKNQWQDARFHISSVSSRKTFEDEDEIIVIAAPDPQGLEDVRRIARLAQEAAKPLIMFNPRLASGDVGIGLNVRRMRDQFLNTFVTTYSLRPIGEMGSVFRRYPGLWQVFVADADMPGRYKLAAEERSRPGGETLDLIMMEALGGGEAGQEPGLLNQVGSTLAGLQRFMRSLSS